MAATVRPRGPLPPRVYWTRRLIVLGVPLVLVVVLARVLSGSADGKDPERATQVGARTSDGAVPTGPLAGPTAPAAPTTQTPTTQTPTGQTPDGEGGKGKRKNRPQQPAEPVLAEPSGPCSDADVVATPTLAEAPGGSDIPITLNLRTTLTEACTWHVSPETLAVTITSGDDHIWSSRECPTAIPVQDVVVRQAADTPVVVTWHARRSDETCSKLTDWADLGWYHVQAAALGGEATDVQFELVAPAAPVVTKTVEPEKQQDTKHKPGEDGGGNSAG